MSFIFKKWHKECDEHKEISKDPEKECNDEGKEETDTTVEKKEHSTE